MKYISDWDKRKERHKAFWEREIVDRCLVTMLGIGRNSKFNYEMILPPKNKEDILKFWTDGEWILRRHKHMWENFTWVGDGFPQVMLNLGPSGHAGYFKGVDHEFTENTLWFHKTDEKIPSLIFEEENFWYSKTMELAQYLVDEAKGDFFVSTTDGSGNADALSLITGADKLLMDMITGEEYVQPALDKIQEVWEKTTRGVYDIVSANNDNGSGIGWLFTWAPGMHAQLQCDLSTMISPELFDKYIMKELVTQANILDNALYHLDGSEQIRHLDQLLSIENLKAIQWTSVAGQPSALHYVEELKKIQAAGKGLLLNLPNTDELEPLMEQLSSKGLHLVLPVGTEEHAEAVLKTVEKLTHE